MPALDKSTICNNKISQTTAKLTELDSLLKKAKGEYLSEMKKNLNKMADDTLSPLEDLQDSVDNANEEMQSKVDELSSEAGGGLESISVDDALKNIADCLGIELPKPPGSDALPDVEAPNIPGGNIAQATKDMAGSAVDGVAQEMSDALKPAEKIAGEVSSKLEKLIPKELIDGILTAIECLADCQGAEGLPTQVDIEEKLGSAGLNIDGKIDFSTPGLSSVSVSDSIKDQMNSIKDMQNSVTDAAKALESTPVSI